MPLSQNAVELSVKRSRNAKHYQNPDKTTVAMIHPGSIHYQAASGGAWLDKKFQFIAGAGTNEWISSQSDVTMRTYQVGSGNNATWWIQFTETLTGQGVEFQVMAQPSTTAGSDTLSFQDGAARTWTYTHSLAGGKMWGPPMTSSEPATTYTFNYRLLGGAPLLETTPEGDLVCGSIFRMPRSYMRGADGVNYTTSAWSIGTGTVSFTMDHIAAGLPAEAYPFRLDPSTTFSITAGTSDGYVLASNQASYPIAAATSIDLTGNGFYVYRELSSGTYHGGIGLFAFDTSTLPDTASISSASLRLTQGDKADTNALSIIAEYQTWAGTTADWESTPTLGTPASAADPIANYALNTPRDLALTNVSNINLTGTTSLKVHMTELAGGAAPTGRNYIYFYSFETGSNIPALIVDYALPAPYIQLGPDGTGKKERTYSRTIGSDTVHEQHQVNTDDSATGARVQVSTTQPTASDPGIVTRRFGVPSPPDPTQRTTVSYAAFGLQGATADTLVSLTPYEGLVAGTAATSHAVPAGNTLHITDMFGRMRFTTTTGFWVRFNLVVSLSGAVATTSPIVASIVLPQQPASAAASMGNASQLDIFEGINIPAGANFGVTYVTASGVASRLDAEVNVIGYEYS